VSIEAIFSLLLFMLLSGFFLILYTNKNIELTDRRFQLAAELVIDNVVLSVNTAILEGDGFSTVLELPAGIYGADYTVFFHENWAYLNLTENSVLAAGPVLNSNVTGMPAKGMNLVVNRGGLVSFE